MKPEISVTIAPDGSVEIETSGFTGKSCQDATRALEAWLGGQKTERLKPEFHQRAVANGVPLKGGAG